MIKRLIISGGKLRFKPLTIVLAVLPLVVPPVAAHEASHRRPTAKGLISARESFPFLALSGAGGHFHSLLISPDLRTLFAGTHLGLFRSADRGLTWRLAAPRFGGVDAHALARDPGTGALYVATHGLGVLRSRDEGVSWSDVSNGLPGRDIHALALDPSAPEVLHVWVVGHGLFRRDGGSQGWRRVAKADALSGVESLAVHPVRSNRLYAGTAKGVWLSDDGGARWWLPDGGLRHRTAGIGLPSWNADLLVAATLEGASVGRADGTSWRPLAAPPNWWGVTIGFAFLPERPDTVFIVTHEGVIAEGRLPGNGWVPISAAQ